MKDSIFDFSGVHKVDVISESVLLGIMGLSATCFVMFLVAFRCNASRKSEMNERTKNKISNFGLLLFAPGTAVAALFFSAYLIKYLDKKNPLEHLIKKDASRGDVHMYTVFLGAILAICAVIMMLCLFSRCTNLGFTRNKRVDYLEDQNRDLRSDLRSANAERRSLEQDIRDLKDIRQDLNSKVDKLNSKIKMKDSEVTDLGVKVRSHLDRCKNLEKKLEAEQKAALDTKQSLEDKLGASRVCVSTLKNSIQNMSRDLADLKKQITTNEKESETLKKKIISLEQKHKDTQGALERKTTEITELRAQRDIVQNNLRENDAALTDARVAINEFQNAHAAMNRANVRADAHVSAHSDAHAAASNRRREGGGVAAEAGTRPTAAARRRHAYTSSNPSMNSMQPIACKCEHHGRKIEEKYLIRACTQQGIAYPPSKAMENTTCLMAHGFRAMEHSDNACIPS